MYLNIFLSVMIAESTDTTMYVLGVSSPLFSLLSLIQAYRLKRKNSNDELATLVQEIVIGETLKIIIPLAYLAVFAIAYVSPNADVLGNVKNLTILLPAAMSFGLPPFSVDSRTQSI